MTGAASHRNQAALRAVEQAGRAAVLQRAIDWYEGDSDVTARDLQVRYGTEIKKAVVKACRARGTLRAKRDWYWATKRSGCTKGPYGM